VVAEHQLLIVGVMRLITANFIVNLAFEYSCYPFNELVIVLQAAGSIMSRFLMGSQREVTQKQVDRQAYFSLIGAHPSYWLLKLNVNLAQLEFSQRALDLFEIRQVLLDLY